MGEGENAKEIETPPSPTKIFTPSKNTLRDVFQGEFVTTLSRILTFLSLLSSLFSMTFFENSPPVGADMIHIFFDLLSKFDNARESHICADNVHDVDMDRHAIDIPIKVEDMDFKGAALVTLDTPIFHNISAPS